VGSQVRATQWSARSAPRVLVVDDEADIRRIAYIALTRLGGMDVIEATSADEGIEAAERHQPDLILLDCMMPGKDGLYALRALRANPSTAQIPVVFLTAKSGMDDDAHLRQLGACGLVMKPFDPMTLSDRVRTLLDDEHVRHSGRRVSR
jgi:two-component system, OmpR family, response regulator